MADDLDSRFDKAVPGAKGGTGGQTPASLDMRFDQALKGSPGMLESRQKGDLPKDAPKRVGDFALSTLPVLAGAGAGLVTGGLGVLPAMGVAGLAGGAGSAVEQGLRQMTGVNPSEHPFQEVGKEAATQALTEGGGRFVLGALDRVFGKYLDPKKLYQSSLKPSGTSEKKAGETVAAGIRHGVETTVTSPAEAERVWRGLNDAVERTITNSPANIPPSRYVANVQSKLDAMRKAWSKDPVKGAQFVEKIDDMEREFLINHGNVQPIHTVTQVPSPSGLKGPGGQPAMVNQTVTIEPKDMSLQELRKGAQPLKTGDAQAIKKQAYETIRTQKGNAFDPYTHPGMEVKGRQQIAKAMKQELEHVYPQIRSLNKDMGEVIELEKQLDRFVKREMNKQSTPYFIFPAVGAAIGGAGGFAGAGAHGAGAGTGLGALAGHLMRGMLEDPAIKSRLAIALDRAAKGKVSGAVMHGAKEVGKKVPAATIRVGEAYKKYLDKGEGKE